MHEGRSDAVATLLDNCQVLTAGGSRDTGFLVSTELYNPRTGTGHTPESMHEARGTTTATLLNNGKVLVAGGHNDTGGLTSSELYNLRTGTWSVTGSLDDRRNGVKLPLDRGHLETGT
ncbi:MULTISPECIES: kelch repeat-containing protein [unclassified Streptomyces]|uniref:kelch repeat-containing protein n=2 Tax=Streptomyces TaxID=1883 RepID=UPI002256C4DC|nr:MULTISPECIES: kelch repeat-containing protein [unclassified Streptomyces]MCX4403788.1 kelch motif-containing protein [Streptomyces sp. NBC_01764]MCX5097453.1 kelch motif-containing protein [Streptomyces sp. NBC_00365]MCX5181262.1 kelch motif-containing protein [Streptomyces sp. NBC_00268]